LAGLDLPPVEIDALSSLSLEAIERFSDSLDHRICRCPLANNKEDK
jgi:hypothetical protein